MTGTITAVLSISRLRAVFMATAVTVAGCTGNTSTSAVPTLGSGTPAPQATPGATPTVVWAAPSNPMELTRAAGLEPETSEGLAYHVHAHLDIFLDGRPIVVPAGIGINPEDPAVGTFSEPDGTTSYGGIQTPCTNPCISPLHTHYQYGILHTESATPEPNTLGQFFTEWGVKLSETCVGEHCSPAKQVAFYVNGTTYTGDPNAIELADHTEIAIVIGTPPADIPVTGDFTLE